MARDPMERVERVETPPPPLRGPGSGRDEWVRFAIEMVQTNRRLFELLDEQSAAIRALEAELEAMKAARRPKGGRPPLAPALVQRVEAEIERGLSDRQAAQRFGISHMSVARIRRRMRTSSADR